MPSLDWNVTAPDTLTIIGAVVQRTPDGDGYPMLLFRGPYDPDEIYYKGDYVTYEGSAWNYINETPAAGQTPAQGAYWSQIAIAEPGANGTSPVGVFRGNYTDESDYYGTAFRIDVVFYPTTGLYYKAKPTAGNPFHRIVPTDTDYWSEFEGNFDSVATKLLIAEKAWINNLGVRVFEGIPATPGNLDGTVANTQPAILGTDKIVSFELTGGIAGGAVDITLRGITRRMTFDVSLANTVLQFVSDNYSTYLAAGVTIWNGTNTLFARGTDAEDITDAAYTERTAYLAITQTTDQEYTSGQKRIDTITLTGVGGMTIIRCSTLYNMATWLGSLSVTAIAFVQSYAAEYRAEGVIISASDNNIIFTSKNKGFDFSGPTQIEPADFTFYGAVSIQGNEIWEDKINSDQGGIHINMKGYKGGKDYARRLVIGDGKGNPVFLVGGSFVDGSKFVTINAEELYLYDLPTSPVGLEPGRIWVSIDGTLKIVQ